MDRYSSSAARRKREVESFKTASDCIGQIEHGLSIFAITRGQFSMIDAVRACLDQIGPSDISLWTWTVAEYEVENLVNLRKSDMVKSGLMVIDGGARKRNGALIAEWKAQFGMDSVRYVRNHAKIATIQNAEFKLLLRGSMNLNYNPRFEQFDLTEGGADFDMVKRIEFEIPILEDDATGIDVIKASRVSEAFDTDQLKLFTGCKVWQK